MSHHEERLEADLGKLRGRIRQLSADVERAVGDAVRALLTADRNLASSTILGDMCINRGSRQIDRACHLFVARHFPSAGVLRFISSTLRMTVILERIGDYAAGICREAAQLTDPPPQAITLDVEAMADRSRTLLSRAAESFNDENAELAHDTIGSAGSKPRLFDRIMDDLIREGERGGLPIRDLFKLLLVFNRIDRVRAQAKNICEETIFCIEGKTKDPKQFNILFIDERNDCRSQLAEAFARKAFSEAAIFASVGWNPASRFDPRFVDFLDRHALSIRSVKPNDLAELDERLSDFNIIIGVDDGAIDRIENLPYQTIAQQWQGDPIEELSDESFESAYKQIAPQVRGLMEAVHGKAEG